MLKLLALVPAKDGPSQTTWLCTLKGYLRHARCASGGLTPATQEERTSETVPSTRSLRLTCLLQFALDGTNDNTTQTGLCAQGVPQDLAPFLPPAALDFCRY